MKKWVHRGGHGALWLLAATLITKMIGVLQKIPLQNVGGDAVFGVYNMVYPLYQLLLILAVSGIPTVISVMIAETEQHFRLSLAKVSHHLMLVTGFIMALIVFVLAQPIAYLLGSNELSTMIRIIAITIFISPLLASYRGYYQGIELASYSSISQLIEQLVRVAIMVIILYIGVGQDWSSVSIATNVLWGGVIGALVSLLYVYTANKKDTQIKHAFVEKEKRKTIIRLFIARGIPAALAAVIVPLIAVIDSFTVPLLLVKASSFNSIAEQFGLYSRIQPLVQLVTMLLAATLAGAIPNIIAKQQPSKLGQRHNSLSTLLYYTFIIGSAASLGLYMLAEPISIMLYKDKVALEWFKLLSFMTLPASILAVVTPILLLEGKLKRLISMVAVSVILKVSFNIVFIIKIETMLGAIYATLVTLYAVAFIALYEKKMVQRLIKARLLKLSQSIIALIAMLVSLYILSYIAITWLDLLSEGRLAVTLYVILCVGVGAIVLFLCLNKFKIISKDELKQLIK